VSSACSKPHGNEVNISGQFDWDHQRLEKWKIRTQIVAIPNLGRISFRNVIVLGHRRLPRAQSRPSANMGQVRNRLDSLFHATPLKGYCWSAATSAASHGERLNETHETARSSRDFMF